jgi:hypothetical protein
MKYHPDVKEFNVLCESLQRDVTLCYISETQIGTGPGGGDRFVMTLQFSDKSREYVYFTLRFAAEDWYQRFRAKMVAV